ncbi:hypothetical protein HK096_005496 [Nowakowskiella sp. JEL0078]|nr:hypothetical protein HK096_005496 [Nowakowskiella sp. JEL0078]
MMFKAENRIYMFGGTSQDGSISRDIFSVDGYDMKRQNITSKITVPGPTIGQSCVSYTNQVAICSGMNKFKYVHKITWILTGGFMQNSSGSYIAQNKVWWFEKERFFELNVTGDFISRGFHSSSIVKDVLYIFGGQTCFNCLSPIYLGTEETYKIYLNSVKVEPLYTSPPSFTVGFLSHVSSVSLSNYILLIGGGGALDSNGISGKSDRNTTFILFDTQASAANYFRVLNVSLGPPPGIGYSSESFNASLVVISGGCSVSTSTISTWTCSFNSENAQSPLSCTALSPSTEATSPGRKCQNAVTSIGNYMVIHGGYLWIGNTIGLQGAQTNIDLLVFDTKASAWNSPLSLLGSVSTSVSSTSSATSLAKVDLETVNVNGNIALYVLAIIFGITVIVILGLVAFCLFRKRKLEKSSYREVESSRLLEEHVVRNEPSLDSVRTDTRSLESKSSDPQRIISMETPHYDTGYIQPVYNMNNRSPHIVFPLPPSSTPPNLKRISITRTPNSPVPKFEVVKAMLVPVTETEMHAIRDRHEFALPDVRPITPLDDTFVRRRTTQLPDRESSKKSLVAMHTPNQPEANDYSERTTLLPPIPSNLPYAIPPLSRPSLTESRLQHDVQAGEKGGSGSKYVDIGFDTEVYAHAVVVARETTKRRLSSQVGVDRTSADSQDAIDHAIEVAGAALRRSTVLDQEVDVTLLLFTGVSHEDVLASTVDVTDNIVSGDLNSDNGGDSGMVANDLLPFKAVYAHLPGAEDELEVIVGDVIFISYVSLHS